MTDRAHSPPDPSDPNADPREPPAPAPEQVGPVYHCDLCGNVMLDLHCKLVCERCGYKRDCSDP